MYQIALFACCRTHPTPFALIGNDTEHVFAHLSRFKPEDTFWQARANILVVFCPWTVFRLTASRSRSAERGCRDHDRTRPVFEKSSGQIQLGQCKFLPGNVHHVTSVRHQCPAVSQLRRVVVELAVPHHSNLIVSNFMEACPFRFTHNPTSPISSHSSFICTC